MKAYFGAITAIVIAFYGLVGAIDDLLQLGPARRPRQITRLQVVARELNMCKIGIEFGDLNHVVARLVGVF